MLRQVRAGAAISAIAAAATCLTVAMNGLAADSGWQDAAEPCEPSSCPITVAKGAFLDPDNWPPDIGSNGIPLLTGELMDADDDSMDWPSSGPQSDSGPIIAVEPE